MQDEGYMSKYWCVRRIEDSCDSGCANPKHDRYYTNWEKARQFWESMIGDDDDDEWILYSCEEIDGEIKIKDVLRHKKMYAEYPLVDVMYATNTDRELYDFVDGEMTVNEFLNAEYIGTVHPHPVKKPVWDGIFEINGTVLTDTLKEKKLYDIVSEYNNTQERNYRLYIRFLPKSG